MSSINADLARKSLINIHGYFEQVTEMREKLNLFEFSLIKQVLKDNPDFDPFQKFDFANTPDEKKEAVKFLNHVAPMPLGHKSLAGGVHKASQLRDKLLASQRYLNKKDATVSDEKLEEIQKTESEFHALANVVADRVRAYRDKDYKAGMVNPEQIQADIDAGKQPFSKTTSMVQQYSIDEKGNQKTFAVERFVGIQNTYANYDDLNNDTSFSVAYGNPIKADSILLVAGDLKNLTVEDDKTTKRTEYIVDDFEAATLAHAMNLQIHPEDKVAVMVVDVRSYNQVIDAIEKRNPQVNFRTYTDTQQKPLAKINKYGQVEKIPSVVESVLTKAQVYQDSQELHVNHQLMIKPTDASLQDVLKKMREVSQEQYPDNSHKSQTLYNQMTEDLLKQMKDTGNEINQEFRAAYEGKLHHKTTLGMDSRYNDKINSKPDNQQSIKIEPQQQEPTQPKVDERQQTMFRP